MAAAGKAKTHKGAKKDSVLQERESVVALHSALMG